MTVVLRTLLVTMSARFLTENFGLGFALITRGALRPRLLWDLVAPMSAVIFLKTRALVLGGKAQDWA